LALLMPLQIIQTPSYYALRMSPALFSLRGFLHIRQLLLCSPSSLTSLLYRRNFQLTLFISSHISRRRLSSAPRHHQVRQNGHSTDTASFHETYGSTCYASCHGWLLSALNTDTRRIVTGIAMPRFLQSLLRRFPDRTDTPLQHIVFRCFLVSRCAPIASPTVFRPARRHRMLPGIPSHQMERPPLPQSSAGASSQPYRRAATEGAPAAGRRRRWRKSASVACLRAAVLQPRAVCHSSAGASQAATKCQKRHAQCQMSPVSAARRAGWYRLPPSSTYHPCQARDI